MENYVIAPRVLRNAVQMAALTGGALLGLVCVLMAIPIAAAVKAVLSATRTASGSPSS
ncbi:hypothetical protein [Cryptosporangium sp. NPDC051539]|uniref:hypothetical protein n=1 Tax=Cryptosporangium sp. NPDC051539 TaxID=3363962 RepID=UPI003788F9C6